MKFIKQKIKGLYLIKPSPFKDKRGFFRRNFCEDLFNKNKINSNVKQANISENNNKFTLRGFHYQKKPYGEDKTITCIKGAIYNVTIDLRKKSKTYKKWKAFRLSEINRYSVHVPKGCANAFLTLIDKTIVHYYCSQRYYPNAERGVRYNDKIFNIRWPHKPKIISEKDKKHQNYKD
mgnify:CR=1 FL=1|tara:strand:- start:96 stop:626 length:531 start_codon:yes stop_codon:yes gene_type:complete